MYAYFYLRANGTVITSYPDGGSAENLEALLASGWIPHEEKILFRRFSLLLWIIYWVGVLLDLLGGLLRLRTSGRSFRNLFPSLFPLTRLEPVVMLVLKSPD